MNQRITLTRYLYEKDEVYIAMLVSILQKSDDSIFWAYELYYSGFAEELFEFIWKIYYDFFATLNPTFESYLLKKYSEFYKKEKNDKIVSTLVQNLLIRPFNTDIFMLRNICELFENEINYHKNTEKITNIEDTEINLRQWIKNADYRSISQWLLNENQDSIGVIDIYGLCLNIFEENGLAICKNRCLKEFIMILKNGVNPNIILLSKIIQLFTKEKNLIKGRSFYIKVESEEIVPYETITIHENLKHYKILEKAYICGIDDSKHLSLFKLKRNKYNLEEKYLNNWLYHASFSPTWLKRIKEYNGTINHDKQEVEFEEEPDDDLMQEFYRNYGYEPDEQSRTCQQKAIMKIEKTYDWLQFYKMYKNNGLVNVYEEELEEFNVDNLEY